MNGLRYLVKPPQHILDDIERFRCEDLSSCCSECLLPSADLKSCAQCKEVKYCGKECQKKAWKSGHKISCGKVSVREVPGQGLGVVAVRDLKIGEIVLSEMPLLEPFTSGKELEESLKKLNDSEKRKIMSLHDKNKEKTFLGILETNSLRGENSSILYNVISRVNHSCVPNVRIDTSASNPRVKPTDAIVVKAIKKGEQVNWCYNIASSMYQTRSERRLRLQEYGIPCCRCEVCALDGSDLAQSDLNRLELKKIEQQLSTTFNRNVVPALVRRKKQLFRDEGLDTAANMASLSKDLMFASLNHGDCEKHRAEGLAYARLLKDEVLIRQFTEYDMLVGCKPPTGDFFNMFA